MSGILAKVQSTFNKVLHKKDLLSQRVENAKINAEKQMWWNHYSRLIAPDKLTEYEDHLKVDNTLVETLIVGLPQLSTDGYPNSLKPDFLEKLMNVNIPGCTIGISFGLVPIPTHESQQLLQEAIFINAGNQKYTQKNNPYGMASIVQQLDARDIAATIESLHDNREKMFHSVFIITIWAEDERIMKMAKSHVKVVMNSHRVYGSYPSRKILKTFLAAQAYPNFENYTFVEMVSSLAAQLCPTRNPNSSLSGDSGLYFGDDRKTGKEIIVDLKSLTAQHMIMVGGSGSGKTFATLLMLGRLYISGRNVVYLTVKPDQGTRYIDMARYFDPDSCIINIGPGPDGKKVNPLRILHKGDGLTSIEASAIYDSHKMLLNGFFKNWLESSFSVNMEAYLDKSLNEVYKRAGIERDNPQTWKRAFPTFENLIRVWEDDIELREREDGESALALVRKTYALRGDGGLSFLNCDAELDLSKGFTVIDLVNVPEAIRPAMNVLMTGMLATFFKVDSEKGTTIAVDEGGSFLRDRQNASMILTVLTQGRSYDLQLIFSTQQFSDLEKAKLSEEFLMNTPVKIVLGSELDQKALSFIKDFLLLDDSAIKWLKVTGKGQGIIKIGDRFAPIAFIPSEEEIKIIKGLYSNGSCPDESVNQHQAPNQKEVKIRDKYLQIAKENKIVFSDWIEGEDPGYYLQRMGFKLFQPQNIINRGFVNCWIHENILKENGLIKNQSVEHYCAVTQLAGVLLDYGFENVEVNHFDSIDVTAVLNGKKYGFEYECEGSHTKEDLIGKKQSGLLISDTLKFVCSSTYEEFLSEAVGKEFVVKRVKALKNWLDEQKSGPVEIQGLGN